jgi:ankyrin repeat protein
MPRKSAGLFIKGFMSQIFLFSLLCLNVCQIFGMRHNYQQTRKFRQLVAQIKAEKNKDLIELLNKGAYPVAPFDVFMKKVESLILEGADPDCASRGGVTALMFAAHKGRADLVNFLLQRGANPNLVDALERSALIYALDKGNASVLRSLLLSKSDIKHHDLSGKDALRYAIEYEHPHMADIFIILGADPEAKIDDKNAFEFTASMINKSSRFNPARNAQVSSFLCDFGPDSKSKIA